MADPIEKLEAAVKKLATDMAEVRGEMGELRGEMGELRGEMGELRNEVSKDITELRESQGEILTIVKGIQRTQTALTSAMTSAIKELSTSKSIELRVKRLEDAV